MSPKSSADGRRLRAQRNRQAVLDALVALIRERDTTPTPEEIAAHAGISRRTLFRLFADLDALHIAMNEYMRTMVLERFPPPLPSDEPLPQRLDALLQHRAGVYEFIMPFRRQAQYHRHTVALVHQTLQEDRNQLRFHLEMLFADDIPAGDTALWNLLEVMTSWQTWHTLRREQGCSVETAKTVIQRALYSQFSL